MPEWKTITELGPILLQLGWFLVSVGLVWALRQLWKKLDAVQAEKDEILKQQITDAKADAGAQLELAKLQVAEQTESRKVLERLERALDRKGQL